MHPITLNTQGTNIHLQANDSQKRMQEDTPTANAGKSERKIRKYFIYTRSLIFLSTAKALENLHIGTKEST